MTTWHGGDNKPQASSLKTEILVIMDKSGSMWETANDARGGFNSFIEEQRQLDGVCRVSLTQFDTTFNIISEGVDVADVELLTEETYRPGGGTALLDAIGNTVNAAIQRIDKLDEKERPDKVFVVIITDGEENSSREHTLDTIKAMVEKQKEAKWDFVFIGANIDAFAAGGSFGVTKGATLQYDATSKGTRAAYASLSGGMTKSRLCATPDEATFEFTDEDRDAQKDT